jgi:hypothetical protein
MKTKDLVIEILINIICVCIVIDALFNIIFFINYTVKHIRLI